MYMMMVCVAVMFSLIFTAIVLDYYGVNDGNQALFARLVRMRARRRGADEIGEELYKYVMDKTKGADGICDIAPIEIFDEDTIEIATSILIRNLLEHGVKPVSLDRSGHTKIKIG